MAVCGFTAHEADGRIEHVPVISCSLQKHLIVDFFSELSGKESQGVIVPTIFQRRGDTGFATSIRRTGVAIGDGVRGSTSPIRLLGEVVSGTVWIGSVLAKIFVDCGPVEVQASLPVSQVHQDCVIAMERSAHVARLASHVQLRS